MKRRWYSLLALLVAGVLVLLMAGLVMAGEEKKIMIVVTADTQGEINPCG